MTGNVTVFLRFLTIFSMSHKRTSVWLAETSLYKKISQFQAYTPWYENGILNAIFAALGLSHLIKTNQLHCWFAVLFDHKKTIFNIMVVMRYKFWGIFERFFRAFLGQMSAKRRGFLTQNHLRPSAYFPPLCRSDKLTDRRAGFVNLRYSSSIFSRSL